jgi:hypothetical protein
MGVKFKAFTLGAPSGLTGISANSFSDNFNRADTALGLGNNWMWHTGRPTTSGVYSTCRISTAQMVATRTGGAGDTTPGAWMIPLPTYTQCFGLTQFVQVTYSALVVATGPANGLGIMITPDMLVNNSTGYLLEWVSAVVMNLRSMASGAFTLLAGPLAVAAGDVVRIEATPGTASNVLRIFTNGTLISTVTDALASRPNQTGSPGMFLFSQPGDSSTFDNFSCGRL